MKKYNAILAMNRKNVIGRNNSIPWYLPEDLNYFRRVTQNQIVIMGRKTYESLPLSPLPKRINIVLTSSPEKYDYLQNLHADKLFFVKYEHLDMLMNELEEELRTKEVFVMGGSEIYELFYPLYKTVHLTIVEDISEEDNDIYSPFTEELLLEDGFIEKHRESDKKSVENAQIFQHIIFENDKVAL